MRAWGVGRAGWRVLPRLLAQKLLCKVPTRLYCFGQVTLDASRRDGVACGGQEDHLPHSSQFPPLFAVLGMEPESGAC